MDNAFARSTDVVRRSTPEDAGDRPLLAALAHGDRQAFWTLWLRHADKLFAVCMREMNGNRVDAEDALGQAMMRAYQKLPRFASRVSSVVSWLARVTSNVCRDIQRARSRRMRAEAELAHHSREQRRGLVHSDRSDDPTARTGEWDGDPSSLIALLPDRLRNVFILRIVQDRPYQEIAEQLSVTCVTARKRIQQARVALRRWRDHPERIARRNT
ncbi:MAG: RNA polymerase sigma factor [Thermoanaerobaculia bacterium]